MADAPASFLDPVLLARLADLSLLARTVVDGVLHGAHRSRRTGSSTASILLSTRSVSLSSTPSSASTPRTAAI